MKIRRPIVITFLLVIIAGNVHAASFDCGKAVSEVEKLICAEPVVSQLDEDLSKTYQEVRRSVRDPAGLRREQAKWLHEVRDLCPDSVCLEKAYRSRLGVLENLLPARTYSERSAAPLVAPLRIMRETSDYRPVDHRMLLYGGHLFFSQYTKERDNRDILALNVENLSSECILRGRPGAQFVAQNEKYLVVSEEGRFANPLIVIDRATNKHIKQIKLRQRISWAKIKGNRLIAIQGAWLGGGYPANAEALIFELPSLKVIKSLEISAGNDVPSWQGNKVVLGLKRDMVAYDDDFNEVFRIALPKQKNVEGFICHPHALCVYGDKAVVVHNCGEILIYDLLKRQLEHTIPSYAHLYTVAVVDGLIFTAPTSEPRQKDSAHVYDLYTGKELAVLPINASHLFAKGNRLLAVEPKLTEPSAATVNLVGMTLYSVDGAAIRKGQWRVEQVLKEFQKAEALWIDSEDLYGAIGLCKSAGIEGLVEECNNSKSIVSAIKQYALWLSKTLDRNRDAVRILEALQRTAPDDEINRALVEARLKERVLGRTRIDSLTAEERRTDFARTLDIGNHLKGAETKKIDFGEFSNRIHFSGNRIYVGNYGWREDSRRGGSIGVLDRSTFDKIASIRIAPYEITSITSDENRIYASVGHDHDHDDEQADRPNFFIMDKASLKILRKAQVAAPSTLAVENGQLLACDSDPVHQQGCMVVDPVTAETVPVPDKICIEAAEHLDCTVVHLPSGRADNGRFIACTKDYIIAHRHTHAPYTFYPRAPDGKPVSVQLSPHDLLDSRIAISGNSILVAERTREGQIIRLVGVPTGVTKTLFGLPTDLSRIPVPLLHDQTLFVGLGRDLLIFDIRSNILQRYVKNFLTAEFIDNGQGLDVKRIGRLMIDRERLIALPEYGENCQIVPLSSLIVVNR